MSAKPKPLPLCYPEVKSLFSGWAVSQRTESRQFLAWFLANYYRLDDIEIDDCICDGSDDKGIDAIYVNDQANQIEVFQSKLYTTPKTLGDSALRDFYGALVQMRSAQSVTSVGASTTNTELAALIREKQIANKVGEGFHVNGVFITNVKKDINAIQYLTTTSDLTVFDSGELDRAYVRVDTTDPISKPIKLHLSGAPHMSFKVDAKVHMVIAPVEAKQLVRMAGIANGELFSWNVRQWLARKSQVNRDIEKSIQSQTEHVYFPAYHNGLTVLCKTLSVRSGEVRISGYAVVNGCQSLTSLYENSSHITKKLRIMTKFIKIAPDSPLARKITDHTNRQNGITHRDLRSNDVIQMRLQTEINGSAGNWRYRIKRGEHPEWDNDPSIIVIENELAARQLLAFDVKEPWSCHQSYRLFDDLHGNIFGRPSVNGCRVILVHTIFDAAIQKLSLMTANPLFAKYGLTRFVFMYLVRQALATDSDLGMALINTPSEFIGKPNWESRIASAIGSIAQTLVRLLDAEITRKSNPTPYDFKRELKSPKAVRDDLGTALISHYQIIIDSGSAQPFTRLWEQSAPKTRAARKRK